jgi:hypothetical protein
MPLTEGGNSFGWFRYTELPQKVGNLLFVGKDLRNAIDLEHCIGLVCNSTAHYDDVSNRISADESSDFLTTLCFAFGGNGTGVDDDEIGKVAFVGFDVAVL